jgi:hypothetical protein
MHREVCDNIVSFSTQRPSIYERVYCKIIIRRPMIVGRHASLFSYYTWADNKHFMVLIKYCYMFLLEYIKCL